MSEEKNRKQTHPKIIIKKYNNNDILVTHLHLFTISTCFLQTAIWHLFPTMHFISTCPPFDLQLPVIFVNVSDNIKEGT